MPCIVMVGTLSDGFKVYGPYENFDKACEVWDGCNTPTWVMILEKEPSKKED